MKYLPYVLKHLRKNWIRTLSTVLGMAVCIFLFCTLQTLLAAINDSISSASAQRLWTRHAVSLVFDLPLAYKARIEAVPGVRSVAVSNWFGGIYQDPKNFFANFATELRPYLEMSPEIEIPADEREALLADRRGALIGRGLADKYGWKLGDTFALESTIPPYRVGKPFEFVVRAIYDVDRGKYPGYDINSMFFHYEYLYEGTNRRVEAGTFVVEIADPEQAGAVSRAIDQLFENSDAQTKTETEGAFIAGFIAQAGNLTWLINGIGLAVAFTILLVTANTMSMAVRERRKEIAVLKTLGFSGGLVLALVLAEAVLLGIFGGGLGILLSTVVVRGLKHAPMIGQLLGSSTDVGLRPSIGAAGISLAVFLGLLAGFVPALSAYRARVTDMLRQV